MAGGHVSLSYTLRRSTRARALRLSVRPDGAVVVSAPHFLGLAAIERFLAKHAAWVRRKVEVMRGRSLIRIARSDIRRLKEQARRFVHERCAYYANLYDVSFHKISIRAQKSRWGSCSKNGNLSFNYRLAALPEHLREYIIVHEVCHLVELNHSKRFWALVEKSVPNHRAARKELRAVNMVFY